MKNVKVVKMFDDVKLPEYATPGSACFDIYADFRDALEDHDVVYEHNVVVGTGLQFEIPEGNVMLVFSRSGQGFKNNVRLANCVGVIDSDYRGELKVKLTNDNKGVKGNVQYFKHGDRIAQGLILPIEQVSFEVVDELSSTVRGEGGFGSTGVN